MERIRQLVNNALRGLYMKKISLLVLFVLVLGVVSGFAKKRVKPEEPVSTLNFVVLKDDNGKPIRNAAVVLHTVDSKDKQERGGLELKSDAEGKCNIDGIPYGKLRIQVLANGFQTYGGDYDVQQPNMDITIKMKRPGGQYSIYENHPGDSKTEQKPDQKQ